MRGYEIAGFVAIATTVIHLSPTTCLDLARLVGRPIVYSSTECRRGGSFDLRLPGPWPLSS